MIEHVKTNVTTSRCYGTIIVSLIMMIMVEEVEITGNISGHFYWT